MDLAEEYIDGITCGTISGPGTLVLVGASDEAVTVSDTAEAAPGSVGSVGSCQLATTENLSLRTGPSVYYARREVIPRGARLTASARSSDWYMVEYREQPGWVNNAYVTVSEGCAAVAEGSDVFISPQIEPTVMAAEAPAATPEASETEAAPFDCQLKAGDIINLRESPGLEHAVLAEIPFGANLIASERAGDWFLVEYEGLTGWVNVDYVFRSGYCG